MIDQTHLLIFDLEVYSLTGVCQAENGTKRFDDFAFFANNLSQLIFGSGDDESDSSKLWIET